MVLQFDLLVKLIKVGQIGGFRAKYGECIKEWLEM